MPLQNDDIRVKRLEEAMGILRFLALPVLPALKQDTRLKKMQYAMLYGGGVKLVWETMHTDLKDLS